MSEDIKERPLQAITEVPIKQPDPNPMSLVRLLHLSTGNIVVGIVLASSPVSMIVQSALLINFFHDEDGQLNGYGFRPYWDPIIDYTPNSKVQFITTGIVAVLIPSVDIVSEYARYINYTIQEEVKEENTEAPVPLDDTWWDKNKVVSTLYH